MATKAEQLAKALVIKNETVKGANTAMRVGTLFEDIVNDVNEIVYVNSANDLTAVDGVITLESGKTYIVTSEVDLLGARIATNGVVNLFGLSSETSILKSTGLGVGVPLITSLFTLVFESISFKDVDTCFLIDGNTNLVALDWKAVNFINIPNVGTINSCDNFIFDTGALLSAQGFKFTGTIGTVALNNSLFSGIESAGNIIEIQAGAVITRRFRIIYSSIVAFGSSKGINIISGADIPIEGLILDTINFSGGGTYLEGVTHLSETALFVNCNGVINTTAIANLFLKNNETETVVSVAGDRYAVAGTSQSNGLNQKFTHITANNSMRYDSTIIRTFRILTTFAVESGNNNVCGFYIGVKKGETINPDADRISESEVYVTTSGTRPNAGAVQALVQLKEGDEVYFIVQNTSGTTNIKVGFMNMIIERTN